MKHCAWIILLAVLSTLVSCATARHSIGHSVEGLILSIQKPRIRASKDIVYLELTEWSADMTLARVAKHAPTIRAGCTDSTCFKLKPGQYVLLDCTLIRDIEVNHTECRLKGYYTPRN